MAMDVKLRPAQDLPEELRPLYEEYAAMLVAGDPIFAESLRQQNYDVELNHLHDKYGLPTGRLYLLEADGKAAGCVGLRRIDDTYCELKRLYVRPGFRGHDFGRLLVQRVLDDAKAIGYRYIRLDTLPFLTHAKALYQDLGFYEVGAYYDCVVPGTIFMERAL